jgi:hypothetical protein
LTPGRVSTERESGPVLSGLAKNSQESFLRIDFQDIFQKFSGGGTKMTWIDGNMVLAEDRIIYELGEQDQSLIEYHPGDYAYFNVEIKDTETGKMIDSMYQQLSLEGRLPTINPFKLLEEPRKLWRIEVYPIGENETYQSMRKRLLLTWDRVIQLTREDLKTITEKQVEINGHWGTPIIPYKTPRTEVGEEEDGE